MKRVLRFSAILILLIFTWPAAARSEKVELTGNIPLPKTSTPDPGPRKKTRDIAAQNYEAANRHLKRADGLIADRRFEEALAELEKAEAAVPAEGWYAARVGHALSWYLNRPDKSLAAYERAISKGFTTPWVLREKGISLKKLGRADEAEAALLACLDRADSDLEDARKEARETDARAAREEIAAGAGWLGMLYNDQGQTQKAIEATARGYEALPDSTDWYLAFAALRANFWSGHLAFIKGNFEEARSFYLEADKARRRNSDVAKFTPGWEVPLHAELASQRAALGRIRPEIVHRVMAVYISDIDVDFQGAKGEKIRARNKLTKAQKERARVNQQLLARYVEVFSGGKMSLTFSEEDLNAVVKDMQVTMWGGTVETRIPVWETLQPALGPLVFENRSDVDTFLLYWNGEGVATTANGGGLAYPYVPWQMYSPLRGFISMPSNWISEDAAGTLLHEFFHVIEGMTGIAPTHGFQDGVRAKFPAWKGERQFDYFRWQFQTTLPRILNDAALKDKVDWKNLNWASRYKDRMNDRELEANQKVAQSVTMEKRKAAADAVNKANELRAQGRKAEAVSYAREALKMNASHPEALWIVAEAAASAQQWDQALVSLERLADLRPAVWLFNHIGWIYQWQKKSPDAALVWYRRALAFDPDHGDTEYTILSMGRAQLDTGHAPEALESFTRCTAARGQGTPPVAVQCTFWKGFTLGEKLGRAQEAYPLVKAAVESGYKDDFTLYYLKKYGPKSRSMEIDTGPGLGRGMVAPETVEAIHATGEIFHCDN